MESLILLSMCVFVPLLLVIAVVRRTMVRPRDTDQVQMTWAENRQLRENGIACSFWKLIALLELVAIIVLLLT